MVVNKQTIKIYLISAFLAGLAFLLLSDSSYARDVEYSSGEVDVRVSPGEPTQIQMPAQIAGGFKKKLSALSLDRKDSDLIIFANEGISESGEAIIVRLQDGRSYSLRIKRATSDNPRDDIVKLYDERIAMVQKSEEDELPHRDRDFQYAPASQVSGLMREMVLMAEFGKQAIPGYRVSEKYKGQTVLNDGTMLATIDKILIGPNLWGYVIETQNLLDQTQRLDPATFRLDGTRAISMSNWELAPRPLNIEEQISGKDKTKIYVITRAKN
ncbi:MAG: type-F conjugative transfer system secretin TraK [Bdellovibrionales bacterium]|nr:type-F conjugative transfer system secretin TraK [Bdellovibrionales bacterium]